MAPFIVQKKIVCIAFCLRIVETIELRGEEASVEHLSSLVGKEAFQFRNLTQHLIRWIFSSFLLRVVSK